MSHATLKTEQTVVGSLDDIAARVEAAALPLPGLIVVGEVVAKRTRSALARKRELRRAQVSALVESGAEQL